MRPGSGFSSLGLGCVPARIGRTGNCRGPSLGVVRFARDSAASDDSVWVQRWVGRLESD